MSRSYKKNPIIQDTGNFKKSAKRIANKKVRQAEEIPDGNAYKKVFESWNISDYKNRYSKEQAINDWNEEKGESYPYLHKEYKTLENWINAWKKMMLRK